MSLRVPDIRSNPADPGTPRRLSVFTRVPVPGEAKTRLVPPLTKARAAALQRAMTEDLLERLGAVFGGHSRPGSPAQRSQLEVRCDGSPTPDTLDIPSGWTVTPQGPGDLGQRLQRACCAANRDGIGHLVIVGSDAPLLPLSMVEEAFSVLGDREVALGPAEDGGYVLIGVALGRVPEIALDRLFSEIPWGTGAVREATRAAADSAGLRLEELPSHWDVDRPEDLLRLAAAIRPLDQSARPRRTAALVIGDAL